MSTAVSRTELILGDTDGLLGGGPLTPRLTRASMSASLEYRLDEAWTIAVVGGASAWGELDLGGERHDLAPGPLLVVSASRLLTGTEPLFVLMGLSLGVSTVATRGEVDGRLTAGDARFSVTVGRSFFGALAPYGVLRAFGGPIVWDRDDGVAIGTDRYHVQAGVGALATVRGDDASFDAFLEIAPAGERSITAGIGLAF